MAQPNLPIVDVIILSWNRTEATLEAINSVLQQRGVIPRIYVVDQGSNAESIQALRKLAAENKIVLTEMGYNVGSCAGRNIAAGQGTADYVVGIDNDAEFDTLDTLAYVVRCFENDPQLGLLAFRIKNFSTRDDYQTAWVTYPAGFYEKRNEEFLTTRYVAAGYAIRRSLIRDGVHYDPALFFLCEEQDLALQVIHRGYKVKYDPKAAVLHKVDPEARTNWKSGRYYYLARNSIYLLNKYYQSPSRTLTMMIGYVARGFANGVPLQALRAVRDAIPMMMGMDKKRVVKLSDAAKAYIHEYDGKFRGSIWQRARRDIVKPLNPSSSETS